MAIINYPLTNIISESYAKCYGNNRGGRGSFPSGVSLGREITLALGWEGAPSEREGFFLLRDSGV